jgi:heme/copper-type cytochrome/quinol oxidase subunit 2
MRPMTEQQVILLFIQLYVTLGVLGVLFWLLYRHRRGKK